MDWQPGLALQEEDPGNGSAGCAGRADAVTVEPLTDAKGHSAARVGGSHDEPDGRSGSVCPTFRNAFRAHLGWNVPFVLGQIGQDNPAVYRYQQEVRDQQASAVAATSHATLVTTSDLPVGADGVHFTVDSYETIGVRFAAAWWELATSTGGSGGGGVQPTQVFVLAGQSNMVGRGQPLSLGSPPDPHLELWRDGAWIETSDPLGPPEDEDSGIGPE